MSTLFHVTIHGEKDEIIEFDSSQPVLHIDMPAGRFLITVRCAGAGAGDDAAAAPGGRLH